MTLESDGDISMLFSFFGQVKGLLLIQLSDIREHMVPLITEWKLVQCDINNDVEISDKAQPSYMVKSKLILEQNLKK